MPTLDFPWGPLVYAVDGAVDAPALLLAHSLGCDHRMWEPQLPHLTERFRVVRYDARGQGTSATPPGPYRIEELGRDALALMDRLSLGRIRFCGLSMGGMVGMWLAINAPERLEKLVLCNTAAQLGPPSLWDDRIATVTAKGMAAVADAVVDRYLQQDFQRDHPAVTEALRDTLLANDPLGYCACCAAVRDMDLRDGLASIAAPTLIISGDFDQATPPEKAQFIADRVPGSRRIDLAAAHLSNVEQAEAFTAALLDFL